MQELTNIIRELLPELMELTMGCEVIQTNDLKVTLNKTYKHFNGVTYESVNDRGNTVLNNFKEIIGHSIQLHHVLKAIGEKTNGKEWMLFRM